MTYILGMRCKDGVVLIGDTKVTIEGGADYAYSNKIAMPLTTVALGSAGIGGLYKDFENRILAVIRKMERGSPESLKELGLEEFHILVTKIIREMHEDYGEDRHALLLNNFVIISASRLNGVDAVLYTFNPYGFQEPVNSYRAIGHGEPYGSLFLKNMWKPHMTMEQAAKLGIFIIKVITSFSIDQSVGFSPEYPPQVVFVPDVPKDELQKQPLDTEEAESERWKKIYSQHKIRELSKQEVSDMLDEVSGTVASFKNLFTQGQFKL